MRKIKTYNLTASNGKHIRKATKIILDNGREIKFLEKLSRQQALKQLEGKNGIQRSCENTEQIKS